MTDWADKRAREILGILNEPFCDCASLIDGFWHVTDCQCRNIDDTHAMQDWCTRQNQRVKVAQALRDERERCALIIAGWTTAENHLPPIPKRSSGWLAERDLEIAAAIRDSDG